MAHGPGKNPLDSGDNQDHVTLELGIRTVNQDHVTLGEVRLTVKGTGVLASEG